MLCTTASIRSRAGRRDVCAAGSGRWTALAESRLAGDGSGTLTVHGETLASHRDGRGAPAARRDDREYREYLSEEQRSRRGCIARRMQPEFHHGLFSPDENRANRGSRKIRPSETATKN